MGCMVSKSRGTGLEAMILLGKLSGVENYCIITYDSNSVLCGRKRKYQLESQKKDVHCSWKNLNIAT